MAINRGSYLFRRVIEVSGEFDFRVADRCNFGQSTVEVSLQLIAHAVELYAEPIDLVVRRGPANSVGQQRRSGNGGGGLKEGAAIHHGISPDVGSGPRSLYARRLSRTAAIGLDKLRGNLHRTLPLGRSITSTELPAGCWSLR